MEQTKTMDKIEKLLSGCKCGVYISVNGHRDSYKSIREKLEDIPPDDLEEISEEIKAKMIETDTLVNIHFYPDTPIGFYSIYHWDLEKALDMALECLEEN